MTKSVATLSALALVAVLAAAAPNADHVGVFAPLGKGSRVTLRETPGGYLIALTPGVELGHAVQEVGADYLVLLDPAGVTETRIPVAAVKAVTVTRVPAK